MDEKTGGDGPRSLAVGSEAVKDPVCGMTVNPAKAKATTEHEATTYYFCCGGCRERFVAEAASFL